MDENFKIKTGGIVLVLVIMVGAFIFFIGQYDPPARPEFKIPQPADVDYKEQTPVTPGGYPDSQGGSVQLPPLPEEAPGNPVAQDGTIAPAVPGSAAQPAVQPDKAAIVMLIYDGNGNRFPNIDCKLEVRSQGVTEFLFSKKSNSAGQCHFYDLEPDKYYLVTVNYNDQANAKLEFFNDVRGGQIITRAVQLNMMNPAASPETGAAQSAPKCIDSDNGFQPTVKGYAYIEGISAVIADECIDDKNLQERSCGASGVTSTTYKCPGSCEFGLCK